MLRLQIHLKKVRQYPRAYPRMPASTRARRALLPQRFSAVANLGRFPLVQLRTHRWCMVTLMEPLIPIGEVTAEDVRTLVKDLQPGTYLATDLYRVYERNMAAANRPPGHRVALGRRLREHGMRRRKITRDGRQSIAWELT